MGHRLSATALALSDTTHFLSIKIDQLGFLNFKKVSRFEKGHIPTNPAFLVKSQNPLIDPNWFEMMIRTKNIISLGVCRVLGHQKVKKLSKKVSQLKKFIVTYFWDTL